MNTTVSREQSGLVPTDIILPRDSSEHSIDLTQTDLIYLDPATLLLEAREPGTDHNFVDNEISETIRRHIETLVNGERAYFRSLELDDKIDYLCWNWASNDADTEKVQAAARLRALNIVSKLEYAAKTQDADKYPDQHTKPYLLPVQDDSFWRGVEHEIDDILDGYAPSPDGNDDNVKADLIVTGDSLSRQVLACTNGAVWKTYNINNNAVTSVAYTAVWQ